MQEACEKHHKVRGRLPVAELIGLCLHCICGKINVYDQEFLITGLITRSSPFPIGLPLRRQTKNRKDALYSVICSQRPSFNGKI